MGKCNSKLADFIRLSGLPVIEIDGIYWYESNGFITPAYLPHCTPTITMGHLNKLFKITRRPFARWICDFGIPEISEWWHIVYEGPYNLKNCKAKTRWQVNNGRKKLFVRLLGNEEVFANGYDICKRAVRRFNDDTFLPSEDKFNKRVLAAHLVPGVMEYIGVFKGEKLVALSENIIQDNAVFWEYIWYDPDGLKHFSSYVLTDFMLNYYINDRQFLYVTDGSRSIYHETNVQAFYLDKFGFKKKYSKLNVNYRPIFNFGIFLLYPFRRLINLLNNVVNSKYSRIISGLLLQEYIRRSFLQRK